MSEELEMQAMFLRELRSPEGTRRLRDALAAWRLEILESLWLTGAEPDDLESVDRVLSSYANEVKVSLTHHAERMELWQEQHPELFDQDGQLSPTPPPAVF